MLREGLVGDHVEMYHNNVMFRSSIDTLAQMLPAWVEGLAEQGREYNDEHQKRLEEILSAPTPSLTAEQVRTMWIGQL